MDLKAFLSEKPQKTVEKDSLKRQALEQGKVFVQGKTKNGKEFFIITYKEGQVEKTTQAKKTAKTVEWLKKFNEGIVFSDKAKSFMED